MRSAAGHDHAKDHDDRGDGHERPAEKSHLGSDQARHGLIPGLTCPIDEDDAPGDDGDRNEEVDRYRPRTESRDHRHAAEYRLHGGADDGDGSQGKDGAARIPDTALTPPPRQRTNDGRDGECGEHEGEQSIAELDVLVPGLLLAIRGDVRALHALGPRGAAQARPREAHDPAGHDDPDLRDEIGHKDAA